MASIVIRNLDDSMKERLRVRAARQGRSMEEEARSILRAALATDRSTPRNLAEAVRQRFEPLGGLEKYAACVGSAYAGAVTHTGVRHKGRAEKGEPL